MAYLFQEYFPSQVCYAQNEVKNESVLFEKYRKDPSLLPDFSYAGYHNGEKEIPKVENYKISTLQSLEKYLAENPQPGNCWFCRQWYYL